MSGENEMVERVAQAIEGAELQWKADNLDAYEALEDCPPDVKARAAIEAMREPTEAMADAGMENNFGHYPHAAWDAMIVAALSAAPDRQ